MTKLDSAIALVVDDSNSPLRGAVVEALLAQGATVVVPAASGLSHDRLSPYDGELAGRDGVDALFASAVERHGKVDVVVLTGGDLADRTLTELDGDGWSEASRTLDRLVWGMRASLAHMSPRGGGRVVVTLGAEAKVGRAGAAVAAAVGHAAYGLVKVAAKEGGPQGVTVNAVLSNTSAGDSLTGRATVPAEVAGAVVLLASPDGGGMSGVAFPVDGGVSPY